jgi:predicted metal-dependent hydrolase
MIDMTHMAPPPQEFLRAVDEFNRRDWFTCHETLEALWNGSRGELRQLYQGLLQIAVALHHWRSGNFSGAVTLLARGAVRLRVSATCRHIRTGEMAAAADRFREALTALGPERMAEVEPALVPRLRLAERA